MLKTGSEPWKQVLTPKVEPLKTDCRGLYDRSQKLFARTRSEIEAEIQSRIPKSESKAKEELDEWE